MILRCQVGSGHLFGLLLFFVLLGTASVVTGQQQNPFRLVYSTNVFPRVNEADIRAAGKIWVRSLADQQKIEVDPVIHLQPTVQDILEFDRRFGADVFVVTTVELAELQGEIPFDSVALGSQGKKFANEYIVLVHRDDGVEKLEQLRGSDISVLDDPRMSLSRIWLDTMLLAAELEDSSRFYRHMDYNSSLSKVVLSVFFRARKACLVSRVGFEAMVELNPQLEQDLHVLIASAPLIAGAFAFRSDRVSPFRSRIQESMAQLGESQAGRQVLTITKSDKFSIFPISIMDESLALVAKYQRLCDKKK